jgi:hypothetical protein
MTSVEAPPAWSDVESTLARLAASGARFPTASSSGNRITAYDPGFRLQRETTAGVSWVEIGDVRACWQTFERLGRIRRRDVLEPGRCSAFMMALFAQVPGVLVDDRDSERSLVLPG